MKELIGLIGGKSGDSITDELHKKNKRVLLIVGKENEPGTDKADIVLVKELNYKEEIYKSIIENKITKVIIATGHILAIELAEYLKERNISISINVELSKLCKDKYLFKQYIESKGFKTPKYKYLNYKKTKADELELLVEAIKLPCVLKSTIDVIQPQLINNIKELKDEILKIFNLNSDVLIEEYIDGNDCTVAIYSDGIEVRDLGVTYWSKAKEHKLRGFENAYSINLSDYLELEVLRISHELAKTIDLLGLCRVDFIVKGEEIYILEVNSVIVCGYTGNIPQLFKEKNINLAEVSVETALSILA